MNAQTPSTPKAKRTIYLVKQGFQDELRTVRSFVGRQAAEDYAAEIAWPEDPLHPSTWVVEVQK